jgi:CheY-like chemotaxis protein
MATHRLNAASNLSDRKSRYLLVVDSDAGSRFNLSILLQRLNYQIFTAKTAGDAIEMATIAAPSVIITTLGAVDRDGIERMKQLKQDPSTADVPFIVLTKQGDQLLDQRSLAELGVAVSLTPPVSPEVLYRTVQAAIETTPRTNIRLRTRLLATVNNMPFMRIEDTCISELSECGMFLRTTTPVAINTRLSLQFDLNGDIIGVEAIVVYNSLSGGASHHEPGMGLKFVRIVPKDQELIRQFIRNEVTRGFAPLNA